MRHYLMTRKNKVAGDLQQAGDIGHLLIMGEKVNRSFSNRVVKLLDIRVYKEHALTELPYIFRRLTTYWDYGVVTCKKTYLKILFPITFSGRLLR